MEKKYFFKFEIITKSEKKIHNFWDTFLNLLLPILRTLPFRERTQKDSVIFLKK